MVAEAGTAAKLISIIPGASSQLKVHILAALAAFVDVPLLGNLTPADIDTVISFLSFYLSSDNEDNCKKAASILYMIASTHRANNAFSTLVSNLSLGRSLRCQLAVIKQTMYCLKDDPELLTDDLLVRLFDILSQTTDTTTTICATSQGLAEYLDDGGFP
jgi:hypothetical protein